MERGLGNLFGHGFDQIPGDGFEFLSHGAPLLLLLLRRLGSLARVSISPPRYFRGVAVFRGLGGRSLIRRICR